MPSRIELGTAKVAAILFASPSLKALMYWRTAAIGSVVLTLRPFLVGLSNSEPWWALILLHLVEHA